MSFKYTKLLHFGKHLITKIYFFLYSFAKVDNSHLVLFYSNSYNSLHLQNYAPYSTFSFSSIYNTTQLLLLAMLFKNISVVSALEYE